MPKRTQLAVNGSGGAYVNVTAPIACRQVDIREDESGTTQGLTYKVPDDNFTATFTVGTPQGPNVPQISIGHQTMQGSGFAPVLGYPAQSTGGASIAANTIVQLRSKTATPTTVDIIFYD